MIKAPPKVSAVQQTEEAEPTNQTHEGEMSHEELRREGERAVEQTVAATDERHDDAEEKRDRDQDQARELVKGKDPAQQGRDRPSQASQAQAHLQQKRPIQPKFDMEKDLGKLTAQIERAKEAAATRALTESPAMPGAEKPPDAYALLNTAKEPGVFWKEDGQGSPEQEDPEIRAAVEELIRTLFGVQGILRVGPGRNESNDQVLVVVATRGFSETSLKSIPPAVHRFPTLLALTYDLLPLRKDRSVTPS